MIIGVLGFIGSGKGTVGEILCNDFNFTSVSFASHLKDVASVLFGWDRNLLEGDTKESREFRETPDNFWAKKIGNHFTPRLALQLLGTQSIRNVFHEDFWVYALENKLKNIGENKNVVVTDVRFKNELNWLKSKNGMTLKISRGKNPDWYHIAKLANNGSKEAEKFMLEESGIHESEWRWVGHPIDYVIRNDESLDVLKQNLEKVLSL